MSVQSLIGDDNKELIEKVLVVMFDDDEEYIDNNSGPYGMVTKDLRDALVDSMEHYWHYVQSKKNVGTYVRNMITNELFVDKQALTKWCNTSPTETFYQAKEEVIQMFRDFDHKWIDYVVHELDKCIPDSERFFRPPSNPLWL